MQRGELWWASLPEPSGSGLGYRRPVCIIQSNTFNQSRIATVLVVVISSNLRLAAAPGNVMLPASASGLPKDSVINVSQILTIDKQHLDEYVGAMPLRILELLEEGLRLVLDL